MGFACYDAKPARVLTHPVIDPTAHAPTLDSLSIVAFVSFFATVVALVRFRPAFAIVTLVASVPFAFAHEVGPTTITLSKVALLAAIVGLGLRKAGIAPLRDPAARALLLAGGAVLVTTALSIAPATYRGAALRETLKAFEYVLLFATVVVAARAEIALGGVSLAIQATVIVVAFLALLEEIFGAPSGLVFRDHLIPRIAGPLEGPNQLAGYLGIALCVVVAWIVAARPTRIAQLALAVGIAAEVLTFSRAGLFCAIAGIGTVIALASRWPTKRALGLVVASAAVALAVVAAWGFGVSHSIGGAFALVARFATAGESLHPGAVGTRSQLWHAAFALWRAHPLLGIGAGNFERELGLAGYPALHTHANSLYLQALVEGGIPLALATVALAIVSIAVFARGAHVDPYVLGALGASVGFALHQSADLLVFYPKVGEMWWVLLALGAARRDAAARSIAE